MELVEGRRCKIVGKLASFKDHSLALDADHASLSFYVAIVLRHSPLPPSPMASGWPLPLRRAARAFATTSNSAAPASSSSTSTTATSSSSASRRRQPGGEAGQHQGRLRLRRDRQALLHHAEEALLPRSGHRKDALGKGAAAGLRPHVDHARRQDALRAVVREGHLERRRWRDRRRGRDDRDRRAARTTRSSASTARGCTWPGCKSPLLTVADTKTHKVVGTVGPFAAAIRPFTVNGGADARASSTSTTARLRDRRPEDRQEAAPRRGRRASRRGRSSGTAARATASA